MKNEAKGIDKVQSQTVLLLLAPYPRGEINSLGLSLSDFEKSQQF